MSHTSIIIDSSCAATLCDEESVVCYETKICHIVEHMLLLGVSAFTMRMLRASAGHLPGGFDGSSRTELLRHGRVPVGERDGQRSGAILASLVDVYPRLGTDGQSDNI